MTSDLITGKIAHTPVLLNEVISGLNLQPGHIIVDGTLGLGGHSLEILKKITKKGTVIGIDQDPLNLARAQENLKNYSNIIFVHDNFAQIKDILQQKKISKINGCLLDLGLSSPHIDCPERGFSFKNEGPLDMRMNPEQVLTAKTIVNSYPETDLANLIYEYGEERRSRVIAKAITKYRKQKKIETTQELASVISSVVKNKNKKNPALLTFQALRIVVNNEIVTLQKVLKDLVELLSPGGRLAVISYHSLEDRIVKRFFKNQAKHCICPKEFLFCKCEGKAHLQIITKKPITPTELEIRDNHRARSAKLRIAEKI